MTQVLTAFKPIPIGNLAKNLGINGHGVAPSHRPYNIALMIDRDPGPG